MASLGPVSTKKKLHDPRRVPTESPNEWCAVCSMLRFVLPRWLILGWEHIEDWPHPIYVSHQVKDRKSVFLAHASTLPAASAFPIFLRHLTALPSLKRATHCMYAYRTTDDCYEPSPIVCGQNDGGESGSGDRLSRLLELSNCENVVVVVSRWYGGVKLGSERWKRISEVAKGALEEGGFLVKENDMQEQIAGSKKCKKKRKK